MRRRRFVERTKNSLMSGFYGVIILALIDRFGPIYGYKIMKFMNEHSSGFFNPSESTIYTLLGHLEKEGLVRSFWALTGEGIETFKKEIGKIINEVKKRRYQA